MSIKTLVLLVLIVLFGVFIYLKLEVLGDPQSHFNQTTRYSLGKNALTRTVLGLHSVGDARAEYLGGQGPIIIDWFAPEDANLDQNILNQFSTLVAQYSGRQTIVFHGGTLSDGTLSVSDLASYKLQSSAETPKGTVLLVFITDDYSPRPTNELSSTYLEDGMVLSINAHQSFLQSYPNSVNQYLLASMLHEFGNQVGVPETTATDPRCIMNLHAGINGQPLEASGYSEPQDFCGAEQQEIQNLKLQYES